LILFPISALKSLAIAIAMSVFRLDLENNLLRFIMYLLHSCSTSFINATGGLKQWLRYGPSYSHGLGTKTAKLLRWGASPRYANKIGNNYLRQFNQWFRNLKLPGSNWRVNDSGHFHVKK
jgi:hypothetical protein